MTPQSLVKECGKVSYQGAVYRLVETQEEAATYSLVDDLDEQAALEDIIDDFKPPYPADHGEHHYLIKTPFRYPPLRHGSRFGTRAEPSFFYASEDTMTCLAEAAFYRFVFFDGMEEPYADKVHSNHQRFSVNVATDSAISLTSVTDSNISAMLTSRTTYSFTQEVGSAARATGVNLIQYCSARCEDGVNVAIDTPDIIESSLPENVTPIQCEVVAGAKTLRFSEPKQFPVTFKIEQFLVDGRLPYPAV